jgi:hypothetical protein
MFLQKWNTVLLKTIVQKECYIIVNFHHIKYFSGGTHKYSEEVLSWNSGKELFIPVKRYNISECAQFNEHHDGASQVLHSSVPSQW